jgi:RES domain-containing protein
MLSGGALERALAGLQPQPIKGTAYRSINWRYHAKPLSSEGSRLRSGRFHIKGVCDAIYMALDPIGALAEVESLLYVDHRLVPSPADPRTMFTIYYELSRSLDLCDSSVKASLGLGHGDLTGTWRRATHKNPAPTQRLGHAAARVHLQGLLFPSTKAPGGINLVVFPKNLTVRERGSLAVHDSSGELAHTLP